MDEIYERAVALQRELEAFNDGVRAGFVAISASHADLAGVWHDAMRREYDAAWTPLQEGMHDYVTRTGPRYVETLTDRIRHLAAYLNGA